MKFAVVFASLALACASASAEPAAVTREMVSQINSNPYSTWKADPNSPFLDVPLSHFKGMLGAVKDVRPPSNLHGDVTLPMSRSDVPDSYDWRNVTYPGLSPKGPGGCVGPVLDQGPCGSCWAHGAVEALGDRFCIATKGQINDPLSPANLMECDDSNNGCNGGMLGSAWEYMKRTGVVDLQCRPYPFPNCDPTPCLPPFKPTPSCNTTCANGAPYQVRKASSVYSVGGWFGRADDIAKEIVENGPVEAAFTVYSDFVAYKSGIYKKSPDAKVLGGHAIKIIGFGVEEGVEYWTVQNSWNTNWGTGGFFKILKGTDECGIESNVVAGAPDLSSVGLFK